MLKRLTRSDMDFLLHIFSLSWSLHSFPSIWKTSSIIPIHKMGKSLDSPAFFQPISLTFGVSKLLERIILSRLLFYPSLIPFSFQASLSQIDLTKPGRAFERSFLLSISRELLTLSGTQPFSVNSFRLAFLPVLLIRINPSFLIGVLAWFIKITKVAPFESVEVFCKNPFLALYFSLFTSMICLLFCLLPSAALFTLMIWLFGSSPPRFLLRWKPHKELWSGYWCLPLNPSKCELSFFSVDPHQANLQPKLLLLNSRQSFLGSPSTTLFPFLNMYLC